MYGTAYARSGGSPSSPRDPESGFSRGTERGGRVVSLEDPRPTLHLRQIWVGRKDCSSGNPGAAHACTSRTRRSRVPSSPPPGHAPQPRAHTGPGPLQPVWIPRVSSQHRGGERGARACVPCSRSASPFWLLRGGNHTSFRRSRWKRIQGTQRSLQPNAAARLLFIETGRSAAGRGGPARAAGTRFLASRARQGVRAGRA